MQTDPATPDRCGKCLHPDRCGKCLHPDHDRECPSCDCRNMRPTPATPDEAAARYPYHENPLLVDALEFAHQRALVGLVHTAPDWRGCGFFPCNAYDAIHAASLSRQQGDAVAARVDEAMVGRVARALCDERGEDWDWTVAHDPGFADALRTVAREALLGVGDRDGGQR